MSRNETIGCRDIMASNVVAVSASNNARNLKISLTAGPTFEANSAITSKSLLTNMSIRLMMIPGSKKA